jgi:hypothetical protein
MIGKPRTTIVLTFYLSPSLPRSLGCVECFSPEMVFTWRDDSESEALSKADGGMDGGLGEGSARDGGL